VIDEPPPVATVQQQQAEQMKVYWKVGWTCLSLTCYLATNFSDKYYLQFIEGMLTNLGALPLDRIQAMLKHAPGYDRTIDQLAAFMEAARREGLVTGKDGMWKLNR
jgi:anaphase-promoting complex subunit 2